MSARLGEQKRALVLLGTGVLALTAVFLLPPIHQDHAYHRFADTAALLVFGGIPNALNVLSNAPFAFVGLAGLALTANRTRRPRVFDDVRERWPFDLLFAGVLLTAFGSAYYHWAPDNRTLFWDRLPMTLGFMALFGIVIRERVSERAGTLLLPILVTLGVVSVLWWRLGDAEGKGDLRLYAWVQFYPLIALPLILVMFPPRFHGTRELVMCIVFYAIAKALEVLDAPIHRALGGIVSGHSLKHLAAATATFFLVRMAKAREPIAGR